jgi:hypothetical protein
MNFAYPFILHEQSLQYRRIYFNDDIKNRSSAVMRLNETPMYIECNNDDFTNFESNYNNIVPPDRRGLYIALNSSITLLVRISDINNLLDRYNQKSFTWPAISKEDWAHDKVFTCTLSENLEEIKGAICVRSISYRNKGPRAATVNMEDLSPEDSIGFRILFYIPGTKIHILDSSNAKITSNEIILQAFKSVDNFNQTYHLIANHLSEKHLHSDFKFGEIILIKDLIMRMMMMFDIPLTRCNKDTSYSIVVNEMSDSSMLLNTN